ncbi:hypothetical protein MN202_19620 [Rheinheimera muenzenbergensis]|uniref:Uncharacterized protein n=1 Tax=Rheinheimera muenzenbergensis TaxID=1193628 RepID=A0ABU8CBT4_9GAMM
MADQTLLLWLPQTRSSQFYAYRQAVERHFRHLPLSDDLLQRSAAAQQIFDGKIKAQGGIFNPGTGQIRKDAIERAYEQTVEDLQTQFSASITLVIISFQHHNTPIQKGVARWHNVQQKIVDNSVSSMRYVNAVSIETTYIQRDKVVLNEVFGLDVTVAPLSDSTKYLKVLRRVFAPVMQS